jgi:hypothetical protein
MDQRPEARVASFGSPFVIPHPAATDGHEMIERLSRRQVRRPTLIPLACLTLIYGLIWWLLRESDYCRLICYFADIFSPLQYVAFVTLPTSVVWFIPALASLFISRRRYLAILLGALYGSAYWVVISVVERQALEVSSFMLGLMMGLELFPVAVLERTGLLSDRALTDYSYLAGCILFATMGVVFSWSCSSPRVGLRAD